jgi:hypothetical protein
MSCFTWPLPLLFPFPSLSYRASTTEQSIQAIFPLNFNQKIDRYMSRYIALYHHSLPSPTSPTSPMYLTPSPHIPTTPSFPKPPSKRSNSPDTHTNKQTIYLNSKTPKKPQLTHPSRRTQPSHWQNEPQSSHLSIDIDTGYHQHLLIPPLRI